MTARRCKPKPYGHRGRMLSGALALVRELTHGPGTVDDLAVRAVLGRRTVYRVLAVLRESGLCLTTRPVGKLVVYSLSRAEVLRWLTGG